MKQLKESSFEEVKDSVLQIEGVPPFSFFQKERGVVITFGVFNSVQQGQQAIIRRVVERAQEYGVPSVVLVFRPRPIETLGFAPQPYFTAQDETVRLIKALGVEHVGVLTFSKELTETRAGRFLSRLVERLPIHELWLGAEALVGKGPEGTFASVCQIAEQLGFKVEGFPSTEVSRRKEVLFDLFDEKDMTSVTQNLGRKYTLPAYISEPSSVADVEGVSRFKVLTPDLLFIPPDGDYVVSLQSAWFENRAPWPDESNSHGLLSITTSRFLTIKPRLSLLAPTNTGWTRSFVRIAFEKALTFSPGQLWQYACADIGGQERDVQGYMDSSSVPVSHDPLETEAMLDRFVKNGHLITPQCRDNA